jgi:NAD(P)H dehydrogenase (quinone)
MRVLVLHAHPDPDSFSAALYRGVQDAARGAGHIVQAVDLYAHGFDPVLGRAEWRDYVKVPDNRGPVLTEAARIDWAEAIVFVFPVWNFGPPAILKGYLDRVFLPGVSFNLTDRGITPGLRHIRHLSAVTTYGSRRWWAMLMGDAPRCLIRRVLRALIHPRGQVRYLAHYDISRSTPSSRDAFLARVRRTMEAM